MSDAESYMPPSKSLLLISGCLFVFFGSPQITHAKLSSSCIRKLQEVNPKIESIDISDETFKHLGQNEVIKIGPNAEEILTYSTDTEMSFGEMFGWLKEDDVLFQKVRNEFRGVDYIKEDLALYLNVTQKQLDLFYLKNVKETPDGKIPLTELSPVAIENLFSLFNVVPDYSPAGYSAYSIYPYDWTRKFLGDLIQERLNKMGALFQHHNDGRALEIAHETFEKIPSRFSKELRLIEENFPKSDVHIHLGIPSTVVNKSEFKAISNAVESVVTLTLATLNITHSSQHLNYYEGTTLGRMHDSILDSGRGVIRAESESKEFGGAHNLEFRQFDNISQGKWLLDFSIDLTLHHRSLDLNGIHINLPNTEDPLTGNLAGALAYIGTLMREKKDPELIRLGDALLKFSNETPPGKLPSGDAFEFDPVFRKNIKKFLEKNRILEKLTPEFFLKAE